MRVLIRVDASQVLGSGHLMRCLTLARQLRAQGAEISFACRELPGTPLDALAAEFALLRLPGTYPGEQPSLVAEAAIDAQVDSQALQAVLGEQQFDWCIVDHYGLAADWQRLARRFARWIMVIDDLANRPHACDLLLDQGLHPQPDTRYAALLSGKPRQLLGPDYALLREEFLAARAQTQPRDGHLQRVLVFFSGGDDHGETFKALQGLAAWREDVRVEVVIGLAHPAAEQLAALCQQRGWHLHRQIDYMARLMADADLAVGAAGSSSWERCALGLPALLAVLAENQREQARQLAATGAAIDLGEYQALTPEDYRSALAGLTAAHLQALSARAWTLVDGHGAARVSQALWDNQADAPAFTEEVTD